MFTFNALEKQISLYAYTRSAVDLDMVGHTCAYSQIKLSLPSVFDVFVDTASDDHGHQGIVPRGNKH